MATSDAWLYPSSWWFIGFVFGRNLMCFLLVPENEDVHFVAVF